MSNEDAIYERLDKAFSNKEWRNIFLDATIWNLSILLLDHSRILLETSKKEAMKKKRPYRLEAWCLDHQEVLYIMKDKWKLEHQGSHPHILQRKLKYVIRKIRRWCLDFKKKKKIN